MKKTLALILAAMMVAGTASVAFANHPDTYVPTNAKLYKWNKDEGIYQVLTNGSDVAYGSKIAIDLDGQDVLDGEGKDVKRNKVFADWKVGENLVEDMYIDYVKVEGTEYDVWERQDTATISKTGLTSGVEFTFDVTTVSGADRITSQDDMNKVNEAIEAAVKAAIKKHTDTNTQDKTELDAAAGALVTEARGKLYKKTTDKHENDYKYVAVIELKSSTSTATKDLAGSVRVGTTTSAAKKDAEAGFDFDLKLAVKFTTQEDVIDSVEVPSDKTNYVVKFDDEATITDFEFGNDVALFSVDCEGQSSVNVGFSTKFDSEVAAKYPEANLEFVKWTANPIFNRTGDLYIYADEDTFIYEVTADGLKEISKAEYDEDYGAWKIRTRKLGNYVISDTELDLSASSSSEDASSSGTSSSNPSTGGTDGTTGGNPGDKYNPNTGR